MKAKHRLVRLLDDAARLPLTPPAAPLKVRTPQDVLDLLEEQINAVRSDRWLTPAAKAKTLAHWPLGSSRPSK